MIRVWKQRAEETGSALYQEELERTRFTRTVFPLRDSKIHRSTVAQLLEPVVETFMGIDFGTEPSVTKIYRKTRAVGISEISISEALEVVNRKPQLYPFQRKALEAATIHKGRRT